MNAAEMLERVEKCGGMAADSLQRARMLPGFGEVFTRDAAAFNAAAGWYGEQLGIAELVPQCGVRTTSVGAQECGIGNGRKAA